MARGQSTSFFDGDSVRRFEQELGARWGCEHVLATSSGTAALHVALMAADVGPGDEVIVPVLTYVATAMAVLHAGATPRFVDVDPVTWNLNPSKLEEAVTSATKAIIPVHIGGVPCDMPAIQAVADRHDLLVIEDASHAHGSTHGGQFCGTLGDLGCFSFGSPKSLTTGEGGAVFTNDSRLAERARIAMNLGECAPDGSPTMELDFFNPELRLDYVRVGWNYRMSVAQAALGLGQLARFDSIQARRRGNAAVLSAELKEVPGVSVQRVEQGDDPCFYCFPVRLGPEAGLGRGQLLAGMARERIDFRLLSNLPLNEHALFGEERAFPVAAELARQAVALRVDPALGTREMRDTTRAIRRLVEWSRAHPREVEGLGG